MVDLELALELAHAEVKRLRSDCMRSDEQLAAAEDEQACDEVVDLRDPYARDTLCAAIRESAALLTEALPDIRRRSASRAARIDVHLVRLRSLLP